MLIGSEDRERVKGYGGLDGLSIQFTTTSRTIHLQLQQLWISWKSSLFRKCLWKLRYAVLECAVRWGGSEEHIQRGSPAVLDFSREDIVDWRSLLAIFPMEQAQMICAWLFTVFRP